MIFTENHFAYAKGGAGGQGVVPGRNRQSAVSSGGGNFLGNVSDAVQRVSDKNEGRVLGMTSVPGSGNMSYCVVAQYAKDSTKEDPVIQVTADYRGERISYTVHVNEVNPENASALEMFALCSYADEAGAGGGAFGSWQKLKVFGENAERNGHFSGADGAESFSGRKQNWKEMVSYMMQEYKAAGVYGQYQSCIKLRSMLERFSGNRGDVGRMINNAVKENGEMSREALMQILAEHREEILEKLKSGDTGVKIPIGSMCLTEEEWEKLLKSFDDAQEEIQEAAREKSGKELPEKRPDTTINGNTVLAPEDTGHDVKSLEELVSEAGIHPNPGKETDDKTDDRLDLFRETEGSD